MTAVSVPAYDRKLFQNNTNEVTKLLETPLQSIHLIVVFDFDASSLCQTTVRAELLGVAGIDVPIADFVKLTMPYSVSINLQSTDRVSRNKNDRCCFFRGRTCFRLG